VLPLHLKREHEGEAGWNALLPHHQTNHRPPDQVEEQLTQPPTEPPVKRAQRVTPRSHLLNAADPNHHQNPEALHLYFLVLHHHYQLRQPLQLQPGF
jgi:hypothetical protein